MKRHFLACLLAIPALVLLSSAALPRLARPAQAATFVFQTDMYGTENVPSVDTVAYGFVRFFFNEARTEADYNVDVKGYSGPVVTGADIHRGAKGVNGPVVKHLADGGFIVTGGQMKLSAEERRELEAGLWYISLKTVDHPEGALRGQIIPPAGFDPNVVAPAPPIGEQLAPADLNRRPAVQPSVVVSVPADPPAQVAAAPPPAPVVAPANPPLPPVAAPSLDLGVLGPIRPPNTGDGALLPNGG